MALACIVCDSLYSDLYVGEIFIPRVYLAPPQGVTPSKFREGVTYTHKTGMIGLPCGEETTTIC